MRSPRRMWRDRSYRQKKLRRHGWQFWRVPIPNPGGLLAARLGCICPVGMNNNGEQKPRNGWVVRSGCDLHGDMDTRHTNDNGGIMHTRSDPME